MKKMIIVAALATAFVANAEVMDRPSGFKVGQRMTIRPYVSLSYTYDSNVNSQENGKSGSSWVVSPGANAIYKADNWDVQAGAYYQYHAYAKNSNNMDESSYGQNLAYNWADSSTSEPGWTVMMRESFQKISQDDDMTSSGGRGVGRDRTQFQSIIKN